LNDGETRTQLVKFVLVGFLNTAIHYGVFLILLGSLGIHYLIASVSGYCCGLINSYLLNRRWTFQCQAAANKMEFIRFLAVNGVALTINVVVLRYAVVSLDFSPQVAQVGAIFLSLLTNFFGSKMIVYSH